jgi:hypothetical protein
MSWCGMAQNRQIEDVTESLRRCVAYGARAERLALSAPLRLLLPAETLRGAPPITAGYLVRAVLEHGIERFSGDQELFNRRYHPTLLRECFALELALNRGNWSGRRRRTEVVMRLQTGHSVDYWARRDGPERELLKLLARQLCATSANPPNVVSVSGNEPTSGLAS